MGSAAVPGIRDPQDAPLPFPLLNLAEAKPLPQPSVVITVVPTTADDAPVNLLALNDDATLARSDARLGNRPKPVSDQVGLVGSDGQFSPFAGTGRIKPQDGARRSYAGDIDDRWAVWMETNDKVPGAAWRLFAKDRSGGAPRLLASAEGQHRHSPPALDQDPAPTLSAGRVWWWSHFEEPGGTYRTRVLSLDPASGGRPQEMLAFGREVSPVTGGVVAVRQEESRSVEKTETGGEHLADHPTGLVLIDAQGNVTDLLTLDGEEDLLALASDGDTVALATGTHVVVMRTDKTPVASLPIPNDQAVTALAVCDGKVGFIPHANGIGESLVTFNSTTGALTTAPVDSHESELLCSRDRIAWTSAHPDGKRHPIAEW